MDAQQFAYWLQDFAELNEAPPSKAQWQSIREHLQTVFVKVTPPVDHTLPLVQPGINDILRQWRPATTGDPLSPMPVVTCSVSGGSASQSYC